MEGAVDPLKCLEDKIQSAKDTIGKLQLVKRIEGVDKLIRKIRQEIRFLEKVYSKGNVKMEQLQSTNLIHLNAITDYLLLTENPVSVLKPFEYNNSKLEVDIVCQGGSCWVKAIARNARALTLISQGNGEYGQKSILHRATCYLECAKNHPHMYQPPNVIFYFAYGIEEPLAKLIENLGIVIKGEKLPSPLTYLNNDAFDESENTSDQESIYVAMDNSNMKERQMISISQFPISHSNTEVKEIRILNLDVSTLLAFVSNMTNGHANYIYLEPLLSKQAEWERNRPLKPILNRLFEDKELVTCQTAYKNFMDIMNVIGGPNETLRAKMLLKRVRVVEDMPYGRIMEKLNIGGKIKDRSRLVFSTGENLKSITISANEGFVRAARMQGIECMAVLHEPRSLSEIKERYATKISSAC